ncbi:MAG: glycoside hydrolase family 2 TIM barrel-domain containing protein [Brevundimonas sp.]|uniref:glycoside hydrolase family 2 protein n=1 Tax=Brevundimonas sp. TaxID=1871086 RepID=UPI00271D5CB9|nr:glycoside hydrolase family 2 TIM barrel-domain containing protein [Brevundimonas sp.]MDO9587753.1 glycoside hydrolase family 2 TIM barrel-domain containing protein [Brevundimonas sp.]
MTFDPTRRGCIGLGLASACLPPSLATARPASDAAAPRDTAATVTLVNAAARHGVDLSGAWRYSIDPYRDGAEGFHGAAAGKGHRRYDDVDVETEMRSDPSALYEYDMAQSPTADLPGAWMGHDPQLRHYQGLMWYRRAFETRRAGPGRAHLRIGAADYRTAVYLNGVHVGDHEGGYTPFAFDVTALLRDGLNNVTLGVDSVRSTASVPPPVTDWETYGGVTRDIALIHTPATFIDDAWVRLAPDGRIVATIVLNGPDRAGRAVRVRIGGPGLTLDGRTDRNGEWTGAGMAPRSLALWSPEVPTLHDVDFEADGDRLSDRVGFRTIAVSGEDILLNGRPVFLRGICLHEEEFGPDPARIITPEAARALLSEAKTGLNCNFVRLAHYPHSEIMTRIADELGLLVWSEVPVYWRVDFANAGTLATARAMLADNIRRDRNRASIILWSVGNETPVGDARNAFLTTLARDVRALDDSRLVTAALLTERDRRNGVTEIRISDPLVAELDVMAVNTYNGWYSDDPLDALPAMRWRSDFAKPLIFSEFGADASAGFRDPVRLRKFSEEFQAEYYRQTLAMAETIPFLRGLSPWILKDFRSPRRQHPVFQKGWNRKGLVTETGRRKQAFAVLADHYARLAALATAAHGDPGFREPTNGEAALHGDGSSW